MRAVSRTDAGSRAPLVGNRLMLVGAVVYLLEWVAIIAANVSVPLGADASVHALVTGYAGRANALGWAAGWFSVVLVGRILIMVGLRTSLRMSLGMSLGDSGRPHALMDVAVSSGLAGAPWASARSGAHVARAAGFYTWGQVEAGHGCPVSMTYAVVPALPSATVT